MTQAGPIGGLCAESLRACFDGTHPYTVGVEEEVLLVDPRTQAPVPLAAEITAEVGDARVKTELPACQVEILTRPHRQVTGVVAELRAGREVLRRACGAEVRPVAAAVHPFATTTGIATVRGQELLEAHGGVVARQLVGALQVHVAAGSADRTLAVYNSLRSHLPELAALAASAPFYGGADSGFASVRPLIAGLLPRQGVPPIIESWEALAADLRWGVVSGRVPDAGQWWWELRPHVGFGTLEVRVPDVQPTISAAAAMIGVVHALVRHLGARFDDGKPLPVAPTWRIAENRWAALRSGVHGEMADLETGEVTPVRRRLHRLIDAIEPEAPRGLDGARAQVDRNGADVLRSAGIDGAVPWLTEAFLI